MKPDMTPLLIAAEKRGHAIHFGIHMLNSQLDLMMQFFGIAKPMTVSAPPNPMMRMKDDLRRH